MPRHVLAVDLRDDPTAIERYRVWHRPGGPPEAITKSLRSSGIVDLDIYLTGNRLVMIIEAEEGFSLALKAERDAADPAVQEWEELMWLFQQPLPWSRPGEKWVEMERIYALAEQP